MKKTSLLALSLLACITLSYGQNKPVSPCIDSTVTKSSDSLARSLRNESFSLVHTASLTMESEYESAILADLKKGNWYLLAFVGAKSSKLFQVTVYDNEEHRVAYEKQKSVDKEGNILIFTYRPETSGYHIINPLQSNKKMKTVCGQLMLFKKDLP